MEHAPTLTELAENDPELKHWLHTRGGRMLCGIEYSNLFLSEAEAPSCPWCEKANDGTVALRRRNTAYNDDVSNWAICCRDCFDEDTYRFAELWNEYYSTVM